jgi:hypothetical protein
MTTENLPMKGKWIDLINESVHTVDDIDNIHYYYIPIHRVEGWDGHVLWLKITEGEAKSKYEKDIVPDPSRYYLKDYPYYAATNYPELLIIQPRHKRPVFTAPPTSDMPAVSKCDLCDTTVQSAEELSKHVVSQH